MWQDVLDEVEALHSRWLARCPFPWIPTAFRRRIIPRILRAYWSTVGGPDPVTWKSVNDLKIEAALWRWAGRTATADRIARDIRVSTQDAGEKDQPKLSFRDVVFLRTGEWQALEPSDGEAADPTS